MPASITTRAVQLSPTATPGYAHAEKLTEESAKKASELLTINHALYHARWNSGFHSHIAHHILTLWALRASPREIQDMWDINVYYQAPLQKEPSEPPPQLDLAKPSAFNECLGENSRYADFLRFFEDEIDKKGMPAVIREYVLQRDERANDIFGRMFTDLVHPMIRLGCGIEFQQPSLVAEALAGACIHESWPKKFLLPAEEYAMSKSDLPSKPLLQVFESLRCDPHIASGVRDTDPFNKIPDGFLKRVTPEQLLPYLSQYRVEPTPENLEFKTREMMQSCAYIMGAAQRPGKRETLDFVTIHSVTLSAFYPAIIGQDWLTVHEKARLLEAKGRVDAVMYAGCRCPELYPLRITDYVPNQPMDGWEQLFHRSIVYSDEGHAVKLVRALYSLEQLGPVVDNFPISKEDFLKVAHMAMDSIEKAMETDARHSGREYG